MSVDLQALQEELISLPPPEQLRLARWLLDHAISTLRTSPTPEEPLQTSPVLSGDPLHSAIHQERLAFDRMLSTLLPQYEGRYVAVHGGQLVDDDDNLRSLAQRVRERFGNRPVLLKRVTSKPDRELVFRSPRLERDAP